MKTISGYFFFGSNAGGRKIRLSSFWPRALVNQKSWGEAQSMAGAAATSIEGRFEGDLAAGSRRTMPAGLPELDQFAISSVLAAFSGMTRPLYPPVLGSITSFGSPPSAGTE